MTDEIQRRDKIPSLKQFRSSQWQSANQFSGAYVEIPNSSGVYVLAITTIKFTGLKLNSKRSKAFYVGKSTNLSQRARRSHEAYVKAESIVESQPKPGDAHRFVEVFFFTAPETDISQLEKQFIKAYQPPLNTIGRGVHFTKGTL